MFKEVPEGPYILDLQGVLELTELLFCALLDIILFQVRLLKAHLWFQSRPS